MSKPISRALRQRFETLKELKERYLIGSQDAHNYLKIQRSLEILCEEINKDPRVKRKLKVSEASNFRSGVVKTLNLILQALAAKFSTVKDLSACSGHTVAENFSKENLKCFEGSDEYFWEVDVKLILRAFLKKFPPGFNEPWNSNWQKLLVAFFFKGPGFKLRCFTSPATKRLISCEDFVIEPALRKSTKKLFWNWVKIQLDTGSLSKKKFVVLKKALSQKDILLAHKVIRHDALEAAHGHFIHLVKDANSGGVPDEEFWLLSNPSKLFERAEREYTLGTFIVERRIALGEISASFSLGDSPEKTVDFCIERLLKHREAAKKSLAEIILLNAPKSILQHAQILVRKRNYIFLALKKNRKWLIDFLSK